MSNKLSFLLAEKGYEIFFRSIFLISNSLKFLKWLIFFKGKISELLIVLIFLLFVSLIDSLVDKLLLIDELP